MKDILEYLAFHSQFLTASVRVCMADHKSPVLDELKNDFLNKYPGFSSNPYVLNSGKSHKLLTKLLLNDRRLAVRIIMTANSIVKRKKV